MLNRRDFIRRLIGGGVGIALAPSVLLGSNAQTVVYSPWKEVSFHLTEADMVTSERWYAMRYARGDFDAVLKAMAEDIDQMIFRAFMERTT